ncbi:MAG TPA: lipoyl(octanoyl) transferase LipB [Gemmatimonadaceae bacterium]|nr:lipoyl(octanoyl) transferase LipB [Gemmatimonadaceae bacterium]
MSSVQARELWVVSLGRVAYSDALELQRRVARARITGAVPQDVLLLVEHAPVVTLGRATKAHNLTSSREYLASRGVELFEVERGGDVTFHGPGQIVGYPIVDLKRHRKDLHWYLRQVEEALIVALAEYGIAGGRSAGYTGVWVGGEDDARRKIASIGVHARDWVTWHGFALNVNTDLAYFDLIVPCGIAGVDMTSVARELGAAAVDVAGVEDAVARAFGHVFSLEPRAVALGSVDVDADAVTAATAGDRGAEAER